MTPTWINLWLYAGQIEDRSFTNESAMLRDIANNWRGHCPPNSLGQTYLGTAYVDERGWRGISDRLSDAWSERDYMDRETAAEDRHIAFEMRRG